MSRMSPGCGISFSTSHLTLGRSIVRYSCRVRHFLTVSSGTANPPCRPWNARIRPRNDVRGLSRVLARPARLVRS